jgi:glycine hydroxymethyltransferase
MQTDKPLPMADLSIEEKDPEIAQLIASEKNRQFQCLELIASENFTSKAVMQAMGSCLTNKYSEGYPGKRYYGGNEFIDQVESLCISRALAAFSLNSEEWGVNVQPLSGSPANFAVYTALMQPGDRIMGLSLAHGGHLTHGHQTENRKISASSVYFESKAYFVDEKTGLIDYDALAASVLEFKPKMLIVGASAYPADFDYPRFREIADSVGAYLMADVAHISGLIATGLMKSPFEHCDIVTSTTHKSLRGPRSGVIFHRVKYTEQINFAVFPMLQGGPHNVAIAALAVQLKEVATPEFKVYSQQVIKNAQALAKALMDKGEKLICDGTINHLVMWDLRPHGLTGSKVEKILDMMHITANKNSVVGDKSAVNPGGIRLGTPALTTRGMMESDMEIIAAFLVKGVAISLRIQEKAGKKLVDFIEHASNDEEMKQTGDEVKAFASKFSIPGV